MQRPPNLQIESLRRRACYLTRAQSRSLALLTSNDRLGAGADRQLEAPSADWIAIGTRRHSAGRIPILSLRLAEHNRPRNGTSAIWQGAVAGFATEPWWHAFPQVGPRLNGSRRTGSRWPQIWCSASPTSSQPISRLGPDIQCSMRRSARQSTKRASDDSRTGPAETCENSDLD